MVSHRSTSCISRSYDEGLTHTRRRDKYRIFSIQRRLGIAIIFYLMSNHIYSNIAFVIPQNLRHYTKKNLGNIFQSFLNYDIYRIKNLFLNFRISHKFTPFIRGGEINLPLYLCATKTILICHISKPIDKIFRAVNIGQ